MNKVIYLIMLFLLLACSYEPSKSEIKQAHQLIDKIDSYILLNGKAPSNQDAWTMMESLGLDSTESCRPCYQMKEGKEYSVYFGTTLGESYSYNSSSKLWQ